MSLHDFIFSNRPRYRIARHLTFWVSWWMFYIMTHYLPTQPFKGWNISGPHPVLDKFGLVFFIKKTLIFNTLIPAVLPHIAYTYAIIYFLLPRCFFKRKNILTTTFLFIGMIAVIYTISLALKYVPYYHSYVSGIRTILPSVNELMHLANKGILVNLPVVAGFAIMIKLVKYWWLKQKETEQLAQETARAELQLLKAQVHPHFLFNTLNNIYFFTLSFSKQAPKMIKKLSGLLHYIMNECDEPMVPLGKEIKMIQDYMALEKIRYGEQMDMKIEIQGSYHDKMISPLLLIPFVENSFKHGTSKMLSHPYVKLSITIEKDILHFLLMNSKPNIAVPSFRNGNIGLKNVKKRLQLLYPDTHELNIIPEPESFTVFMKIGLGDVFAKTNTGEIKQKVDYALA